VRGPAGEATGGDLGKQVQGEVLKAKDALSASWVAAARYDMACRWLPGTVGHPTVFNRRAVHMPRRPDCPEYQAHHLLLNPL
jgi:hypothetical protein